MSYKCVHDMGIIIGASEQINRRLDALDAR
jgi:hypothetical protein